MISFSNKKVLVTGATGFTGRKLVKACMEVGANVLGLAGSPTNESNIINVDILDFDTLKRVINKFKPDYVFHLAAISFVGHVDVSAFYIVNVIGTENLLRALKECDFSVNRILISSTANVYGSLEKEGITEIDRCEPISHYAISKLAMEKVIATYYNYLDIIITRPFNYTGLGQSDKFLVPKIVKHFKQRKEVIELGNTDIARDFSSVDFIVNAYIRLMLSSNKGTVFNICSGKLFTIRDILNLCTEYTGHKLKIKINPDLIRENEIKIMSGSHEKLFSMVGTIPVESFENTLKRMLQK